MSKEKKLKKKKCCEVRIILENINGFKGSQYTVDVNEYTTSINKGIFTGNWN